MAKVSDLLAVGLVLISLFIISISLQQENIIIKLIGLIGGFITLAVEGVFLKEIWLK